MLRLAVSLGFAAASFVLAAATAQATIIASYTFGEGTTTSSVSGSAPTATSVVSVPGATASVFTSGPGIIGLSAGGFPNSTISSVDGNPIDSIYSRASATGSTEAAAVTGGDYFTFTITPDPLHMMSFTQLSFDHTKNNASLSGGGTMQSHFAVRTSLDAFSTTLGVSSHTANNINWQTFTLNLDDLVFMGAFQNLTGPVEFRIYTFDNNDQQDRLNRLDNVLLMGSITAPIIPEPTTLAMLGLGGLLLACRRRRRK